MTIDKKKLKEDLQSILDSDKNADEKYLDAMNLLYYGVTSQFWVNEIIPTIRQMLSDMIIDEEYLTDVNSCI